MTSNYDEARYRHDSQANDQAADSNSEVEDSVVNLKPREPKKEIDQEDDEFVKAFESLLTENIAVIFSFYYLNINVIAGFTRGLKFYKKKLCTLQQKRFYNMSRGKNPKKEI